MNASLCAIWLFRHVCWSTTRYQCATDGRRAFTVQRRETFHPEVRCEAQWFLGRTWSAPEASETTAVKRVCSLICVRGPARRLKFPRPVNHRTSPGLVQSSLPLISATARWNTDDPIDYFSSFITALICFLWKCNMLMFIWWRELGSFSQTHCRTNYRPKASGFQIHEEFNENYLSSVMR